MYKKSIYSRDSSLLRKVFGLLVKLSSPRCMTSSLRYVTHNACVSV